MIWLVDLGAVLGIPVIATWGAQLRKRQQSSLAMWIALLIWSLASILIHELLR